MFLFGCAGKPEPQSERPCSRGEARALRPQVEHPHGCARSSVTRHAPALPIDNWRVSRPLSFERQKRVLGRNDPRRQIGRHALLRMQLLHDGPVRVPGHFGARPSLDAEDKGGLLFGHCVDFPRNGVDHDSGAMRWHILVGWHEGRSLDALPLAALTAFGRGTIQTIREAVRPASTTLRRVFEQRVAAAAARPAAVPIAAPAAARAAAPVFGASARGAFGEPCPGRERASA